MIDIPFTKILGNGWPERNIFQKIDGPASIWKLPVKEYICAIFSF
jgi:hypothetical protein